MTENNEQEFPGNMMSGDENASDFPDGKEVVDNRIPVTELEKAEEQYDKRISFKCF